MRHRLVRTCASLIVLASLVFSLPVPVLAMPFNAAVNYAAGNEPISIAAGDFNNDGKPDLAVVNYLDSNIGIYIGRGDGTFNAAVNYSAGASAMSVAVGDFNRDGKLDLVAANSNGGSVSVLIGNGDGTFNAAVDYNTGPHPSYVAVGDFSGDGKLDLAVPDNFNGSVFILIGNGDGTFNAAVEYGAGSSPTSVAVGDFNADGRLDLAVTNSDSSNVSVLKGNGDGTFNAAVNYNVGSQPYSVAVGDFNGDSKPDLAVANATNSNISILIGKGDGTFNAPVTYNTGYNTWTVTVGDFNRDGSPDVAGANMGSYNISVLLNAVPCAYTLANVTAATVNTNLGPVNLNINAGSISNVSWSAPGGTRCSNPPGYYFPYGMFGFNITNLTAGQQVAVTIRFPNPLPLGARYYKCINGRMVDCSSLITRVNEYTLILTLTDGGLGDADGAANGAIVDPGGPAFPLNTTPQSSSAQMPATTPQKPVSLSNISVKNASLSATKVTPGTPVTVTANLANTGTGNGTSVVKVYVNGAEEAQQGVSVNSGGTSTVTFDVSRNEPGTYTVYVGGTKAGSFTVDQFTPETILYISGALVFFALVVGVIWMTRRRAS